eukprot:12921645-Prorocentrum_lima.AAC.1
MDLTGDSSERASKLQRITRGEQGAPQKQQQPQSPSVVPAPTVDSQLVPSQDLPQQLGAASCVYGPFRSRSPA